MATQDDSFPDPMEAAQRILQERAGGGTPSPAAPTVAEPQGGPGGEAAPAGLPAASERPGRWAVNPITGKEARLPDPEPGLPQGPLDAILTGQQRQPWRRRTSSRVATQRRARRVPSGRTLTPRPEQSAKRALHSLWWRPLRSSAWGCLGRTSSRPLVL